MGSLIAMTFGALLGIAIQLHINYHGRRYVIGHCDLHEGLCGRVEFTTHLAPNRLKKALRKAMLNHERNRPSIRVHSSEIEPY